MQKKKAREEIQHKEFCGPQDPPPRNSLCRPFSCILKGKEAPYIKNLRGEGLGGGGFLHKFFMFMPFLVLE